MDDAGDRATDLEQLYWKAYNLGERADLPNIIKPSLNNLEFLYDKIKDKTSLQKVKELKAKYVNLYVDRNIRRECR